MKFNFRGGWYSGQNLSGSRLSLPLSNRSFPGRSEGPQNQPKDPLLCLTLSTPSFLECTIIDAATNYPLYRIKTASTTTTVMRRESVSSSVVASSVKWPKIIPMKRAKARAELVLVNMRDGPWRGGNSLLKPGSRNKFRLPDYDNSLTWKLHGDLFLCTTPSVVGVIATLDPRRGSHTPKLTVYEHLYDEFKPRQSVYGGVPILLLDYLVVTALLLVTDLQEWSLVPRAYSRSDQAGFGSAANLPMWKEEAWYTMANRGNSSPSMASTIRTGSSSHNPSVGEAGPSHAHNHQRVDIDPEDEYVSQWRRSLSPVSEAMPEPLHHRPSGSPPAADNRPDLIPEPTQSCPPPHRNSVIPDDIDGNVFPSVLQMIHPFHGTEMEREQNHITSQLSSFRNPRPLPHPPTSHLPPAGDLGASLRSQHRSARILPSTPYASCQLHVTPGLHTRAVTLLDDPPSQNSQAMCPANDVYGHGPITKASRINQWINSLTDSSNTENALELLVRASIIDSPPPPYNSLWNSNDTEGN